RPLGGRATAAAGRHAGRLARRELERRARRLHRPAAPGRAARHDAAARRLGPQGLALPAAARAARADRRPLDQHRRRPARLLAQGRRRRRADQEGRGEAEGGHRRGAEEGRREGEREDRRRPRRPAQEEEGLSVAAPPAVGRVNYFFRTLVYGAVVGLLAWGGWHVRELVQRHEQELAERDHRIQGLVADVAQRDQRIAEQAQQIEELQAQVRALELALKLLKVDQRLARLSVRAQRPAPGLKGGVETDVVFQELDAEGEPLGPAQPFTLVG